MSADRRVELRVLLAAHAGTADLLCGVCELCVSELAVSGARVRVLGGVSVDGGGAVVYATDPTSGRLEDLAVTAGVGPVSTRLIAGTRSWSQTWRRSAPAGRGSPTAHSMRAWPRCSRSRCRSAPFG